MGTLSGIRIIELGGIGPVPFCGMLLAEMGAEVVRVDRPSEVAHGLNPLRLMVGRSKRAIGLNLKSADGMAVLHRLLESADVLLEGFRPGVLERIGVGPDVLESRHPSLVVGRMTGWGQTGPYSEMAGHDINYIAMSGALGSIGRTGERPVPPLNLVGDYGGGALYLAVGVLAALVERQGSGRGQVIDGAMIDGAASLMTPIYQMFGMGHWVEGRESNLLDGAAPFYDTYETADGKAVAVGPLEEPFYLTMLEGLGLDQQDLPDRNDVSTWPELKERFGDVFRTRTRAEWERIFFGTDACVTPVLTIAEAQAHRVNTEREVFVAADGIAQPGPAPRFSRTPSSVKGDTPGPGQHTDAVLDELGYGPAEVQRLRDGGAVA
ncbi:Alpha-methylacyl-CoA racemase [hydrothermal vent metagenome]|uniref:Alpha-methylacyl-CoA racemase n=1 Tax=hydrothermal vent metagenome TaxID=652676 RepID=A0A3B0RPU6_9ZZZZ